MASSKRAEADARHGRGHDLERTAQFPRTLVRGDVGGNPPLVHERAIQARGLARGEHVGQQVEFGIAVGVHRRAQPAEVQPRKLDPVFDHAARRNGTRRRGGHGGGRLAGGNLSEARGRQFQRAIRIHVAGDRQRRIRRVVVAAEERAHVVGRRGPQVIGRTDGGPLVGVAVREEGVEHRESRHAVGPVLVVLAPLVQHDVALVVELRLREGWAAGTPCDRIPSTARVRARWPARLPSSWCDRSWWSRSACPRPAGEARSSPSRGAPSPRTSGARRGGRSPSGQRPRSSSPRDTRR